MIASVQPEDMLELAKHLSQTLVKTKQDALSIFEPMPSQTAFFQSIAPIRLCCGGHRSGKTTCLAELAYIVSGRHPYYNYPEKGKILIVGESYDHIGNVLAQKLFVPGEFMMCVREPGMPGLRPYYPDNDDILIAAGELEKVPGPPLIPFDWIKNGEKGIAWEDKRRFQPRRFTTKSGWNVLFLSAGSNAPRGAAYNVVVFDEEVTNEQMYTECAVRGTVDHGGRFWWSMTPQSGTATAMELYNRCMDPVDYKDHEYFHFHIAENPHVSTAQKDRLFTSLLTDEDRAVRWDGVFARSQLAVYPEFDPGSTGMPGRHAVDVPFRPPADWTKYMVVDPGRQVCAVLFAAVPPTNDKVYIYDELYIRQSDVEKFGDLVKEKLTYTEYTPQGEVECVEKVEAFIIDMRMGRQTLILGRTVVSYYSDALRDRNIRSRTTGYDFLPGNDDVAMREAALRRLLAGEQPRLRVMTEHCPNLVREMRNLVYRKMKSSSGIDIASDKRVDKNDHTVDCLEYLAAYDPVYVPGVQPGHDNPLYMTVGEYQEYVKNKRRPPSSSISLGPGGTLDVYAGM